MLVVIFFAKVFQIIYHTKTLTTAKHWPYQNIDCTKTLLGFVVYSVVDWLWTKCGLMDQMIGFNYMTVTCVIALSPVLWQGKIGLTNSQCIEFTPWILEPGPGHWLETVNSKWNKLSHKGRFKGTRSWVMSWKSYISGCFSCPLHLQKMLLNFFYCVIS